MTTTGNARKLIRIIITFLIVLLCAVTVNLPAVKVAAEGEAEAVEAVEAAVAPTPESEAEARIADFIKAVQTEDMEKIASFCTESTVDRVKYKSYLIEKIAKPLLKKVDYKILFSDSEEGTATVKLRITNADANQILDDVEYDVTEADTQSVIKGKRLTDKERDDLRAKYFAESAAKKDAPTITSEVYVTLVKDSTDGIWRVELTGDFKNAIFGLGRSLAEARVVDFLEALKRADSEKVAACFSGLNSVELKFDTDVNEKVAKMILKKLKYERVSADVGPESADITYKVQYIDTIKLLEGIQNEVFPALSEAALSGQEITDELIENSCFEYIENSIASGSASTETSEIDFKLVLDENGENWLIEELDDYVVRAIIGYLN